MKQFSVLVFLLLACDTARAQGTPPYRTVVRTSGDTTIARTTGEVHDAHLKRLVLEWQASTDLADGGLIIGDVRNMAVGPDGRVYVWDPATPTLWMLDATGKTLKRISRRGAGPGEYAKEHNGIVIASDGRLKMWDEGNARINIYDPDGRYLSSNPLGFSHCCPGGALTADNQNRLWLRTLAAHEKGDVSSIGKDATLYFRTNALGVVVDTVTALTLPGNTPPVTATRDSRGRMNVSSNVVPYSTSMLYTVSPLGHIVFGQTRPYVIHSMHNGKPLRIERDWTPVPVSNDERAQIRANLLFQLHQVDPDWKWTADDVSAVKPAMNSISVAQDGRIWVSVPVLSEKFTPDAPPAASQAPRAPPITYRATDRRWDVFESDGRYLGRVVAPRTFGLYIMKGNSAWGVMRDENDIPTIVKMRIEPPM